MRVLIFRVLYSFFILLLILSISFLNYSGYIGNTVHYQSQFNIDFNQPITMVQAPNDNSYIYVGEKSGRILKIYNERGESSYDIFLDLSDRVHVGSEDGLLGMTFHPSYPQKNLFYVFYSILSDDCQNRCYQTIISEFNTSNGMANIDSERILISNFQPYNFHRAGTLKFGPDQNLFINIGDGTMQWQAQNTSNFYGKILRINVNNHTNSSLPYSIPNDNPFVNNDSVRNEIYSLGLRNPFRGDFDRLTGDYWIGDVGNDMYEEVNKIQPGENYGYPYYEAVSCRFNCSDSLQFNDPEFYYNHPGSEIESIGYQYELQDKNIPYGIAIIGTTIYRGDELNINSGNLIVADYLGLVYSIDLETNETKFVTRLPNIISEVYQDVVTNELYIVGIGVDQNPGSIYKLINRLPVYLISSLIVVFLLILLPFYLRKRSKLKLSQDS